MFDKCRLRDEVDRVLGARQDITFEDLSRLEYTGWVFKEALRKWPPVAGISRNFTTDHFIDGVLIPKDAWVVVSFKQLKSFNQLT